MPEYVYNGAPDQVHKELGLLEPGKKYEVTRDQAKWLSPEAGWAPAGKVRETRKKAEEKAEREAKKADQAADVPGNPDVMGDDVAGGESAGMPLGGKSMRGGVTRGSS